jgi:outer membrane protein assembly factor BamB
MDKNSEQRTGFYDTAGVPILHGIKWKIEVNKENPYINSLYNGILYLLGNNPYTDIPYTIDTKSGKLISKLSFLPCCIYNNIVIGYEYSEKAPHIHLNAWNLLKKQKVWENNIIREIFGSPSMPYLSINKDILYYISWISEEEGNRFFINLINPMTGKILEEIEPNSDVLGFTFWNDIMLFAGAWCGLKYIDFSKNIAKHEVKEKTLPIKPPIWATPVVYKDILYIGNNSGYLYSINLLNEKINWNIKCNLLAFSQLYSSITIYDGIIYVSNIDSILYIDENTGKILLSIDMKDHSISRPAAITRDGVYFASDDGILFAFDRKTGKELWKIKLAKRCMASPIISNGAIYISAFDSMDSKGYVFAIY